MAGAVATGTGGALVLTGVHGWSDAAAAPSAMRPDHVVPDLRGLLEPYPERRLREGWWIRGPGAARVGEQGLETSGRGLDVLRAALDALWAATDEGVLDPSSCREEMTRAARLAG